MLGTKVVLRFVLEQARAAFQEREFVKAIAKALANELRAAPALNTLVSEINDVVGAVAAKYRGMGPTGYFLKAAIAAQVRDLGKHHPDIATALEAGQPYLEEVLDGLTVDELLHGSRPLVTMVFERAKAVSVKFVGR